MPAEINQTHVKRADTRDKVKLTEDQETLLHDAGYVPQIGRPAEKAGGLGALASAVSLAAGWPVEVVAACGIAAGLLPGLVTYIVDHGGLRGVIRSLWWGRG